MEAVYGIGKESATERVGGIVLSTSIVANGSLVRPLHLITLIGEHRVRLGAIGDQDTLEGIHLNKKETQNNRLDISVSYNSVICFKYPHSQRVELEHCHVCIILYAEIVQGGQIQMFCCAGSYKIWCFGHVG